MQFLDDSLLPENQEKLVIQVAPYGPQWIPGDSDDIPVTMDEQVQKAVDCYNAGATVLHVHVREADGKGSKRLSMFNEMIARLRAAVPGMVLQVGGSISFATSVVSIGSSSVASGSNVTVTLQAKDAAGNSLTTGGATVTFTKTGGTSTYSQYFAVAATDNSDWRSEMVKEALRIFGGSVRSVRREN